MVRQESNKESMHVPRNFRWFLGWSPGSPPCAPGRNAAWMLLCVLALLTPVLPAQEPTITPDGIRKQLNLRQTLSCSVRTAFPVLLFDFKMHSPFVVTLPMKPLKESEQVLVRVWTVPVKDLDGKPFPNQKNAHFLANRFRMADLTSSGNQFLQVNGSIATGAGEYRHYLSVDNGKGLGCVKEWKVKAKPSRELLPELVLKPGEATDPRLTAFLRQRTVPKQESGIRVAVMLNVDNRSWRRVITDSNNMIALAAALRRVAEDERVREVALTAFSLEDQTVFFDQQYTEIVDFRRLGNAFRQMKPGQVEVSKLSLGSEARFLAGILREREDRLSQADLILFVGARSLLRIRCPRRPWKACARGTEPRSLTW